MPEPIRLGMLTPSSNTMLEPMTTAMLSGVPNVTAHFSRFRVTEIAIADSSDRQFDEDEILESSGLAHPRQGQCHRLERDVGELAGLRAGRAALCANPAQRQELQRARRSWPSEKSSSAPAFRASGSSRLMSPMCRRK